MLSYFKRLRQEWYHEVGCGGNTLKNGTRDDSIGKLLEKIIGDVGRELKIRIDIESFFDSRPTVPTTQQILEEYGLWKMVAQKDARIEKAIKLSREAEERLRTLENILRHALEPNNVIGWRTLKSKSKFSESMPQPPKIIPTMPLKTDRKYRYPKGDLHYLKHKRGALETLTPDHFVDPSKLIEYKMDCARWEEKINKLVRGRFFDGLIKDYQQKLGQWAIKRNAFPEKQKRDAKTIEQWSRKHVQKHSEGIIQYFDLVLKASLYPDYFPKDFILDYNPQTRILAVDYSLPALETIPRLKEVRYIAWKDEFREILLSESATNKLYDSLVYQITLRTIYELYTADGYNGTLAAIVFNGWVKSIDKATGLTVNACIASLQVNREEFASLNLSKVDPKACFKGLRGIGSSKMHSLTPIPPILAVSREDKRFISSYDVADNLDESVNLAAMDWEDFEHLIRELFEKEFSQYDGEVKITQASRDRGVDAVAFDPDPIRGGKIVIQAKRYTNTVGVAAVRDLYGTVINEGAMKGILISTADYGPDAYDFAKGKPITLLNGGNLLHMLGKYGRKARIDLKEAKQMLAEKT